jgi:hypothetical protein
MTYTGGTILFVKKKLLPLCLFTPKKDVLLKVLTLQIYDKIIVNHRKVTSMMCT